MLEGGELNERGVKQWKFDK